MNVDAVLLNQEAQQATLARVETVLDMVHTLLTLRTAAREQREGRSMLFDNICATQARRQSAVPHTTGAPLAETSQRPSHPQPAAVAGANWGVDEAQKMLEFDVRALTSPRVSDLKMHSGFS